jgi:hypothetical protein
MEDDLKKNKNLFSIPLKSRGKPFLGLAQLSKIFDENIVQKATGSELGLVYVLV